MPDLTLFGYPVHVRTILSIETSRGPIIVPARTHIPSQFYTPGALECSVKAEVFFKPDSVLDAVSEMEARKICAAKVPTELAAKTPNEVAADHLESAAKALREAG